MTISSWVGFGLIAVTLLSLGGFLAYVLFDDDKIFYGIITLFLTIAFILGTYGAFRWYHSSTASGQRALTDQKSELSGGLNRRITVYTADGNILAEYEGKIDIEGNDGGYVLFDYEGKRYMYYNCFVESIADIES